MKKFVFTLFLLGVLGTGVYFARDIIFPGLSAGVLKIVMSTEATDISPYGLNLNNATRISNIYEGLVTFDANLRVVPALAVSWGNKNDTTWEFRLREGVKFHNGSDFTGQDVIDAFKNAQKSGNAQIEPHIKNIADIRLAQGGRLEVVTTVPDPLLLSKLTKLFVYKDGNIGTGPYQLDKWVPGNRFSLSAYEDYWGAAPTERKVVYEVQTNRIDREDGFESGKIDILAAVTEDQALSLPAEQVKTGFGLEVNFLMFKLDDPLLEDRATREAILALIDPAQVEAIGNYFVRSANQFIAPGVFGYNQDLSAPKYDEENEPHNLFGVRLERINFDFLSSYRTLSEYVTEQLSKAGFKVEATAREPQELLDMITANESQLYLLGWRAADGDAGSFFEAFIHSNGVFNGGRYENAKIDALIEQSRTEMNPQQRLSLLRKIGAELDKDLIGIPLFDASRLYAVKKGIRFEPRLDGLILASEVSR